MPAARQPDSTWELGSTGRALVFLGSGNTITAPVVLVADGAGATDFDALTTGLDGQGSFLEQALERRLDVVVVGRTAPVADMVEAERLVREVVHRTVAEAVEDRPLAVVGIGRGALVARAALAGMETERMDHRTATYVSYDGAAPNSDEQTVLQHYGDWPQRPRLIGVTTSGATGGPADDDFHDVVKGSGVQGPAVIDGGLATAILERL
jgi:hypothetical protein